MFVVRVVIMGFRGCMRVFEPIFDLRSKRLLGYEVLYRGVGDRENFFETCTEEEDLEIFLGMVKSLQLRPIIERVETLYRGEF